MSPLKVGITGGIGSGKSVVCRLFALWGAPVYDSDARAKELMNGVLVPQITKLLGPAAYRDGTLDRKYVASRVFADAGLLARLNAIVHPAVGKDFERWAEGFAGRVPYVVQESAILFSSGFNKFMDRTVAVTAPENVRIARVVERDGCTPESVRARIAAQQDESALADYLIYNDGRQPLTAQVATLHKLFCDGREEVVEGMHGR
jgi:dephospho-CoA kinase